MSAPLADLAGLLRSTVEDVVSRLGAPRNDRTSGADRWIAYQGTGWSLRIRARPLEPDRPSRVRSWTMNFEDGVGSFAAACEAVGLAVAEAPEAVAARDEAGPSMLRCALPDATSSSVYSLTASRTLGRIRSMTAFDEPPDWEHEAGA